MNVNSDEDDDGLVVFCEACIVGNDFEGCCCFDAACFVFDDTVDAVDEDVAPPAPVAVVSS